MMKFRNILLLLFMLCPIVGMAQEKYTDQLKRQNSSGAAVVVYQDAELEELVNGSGAPSLSESRDSISMSLQTAIKKPERPTSGPHTKIDGYRVQIYMAGNTAQDKAVVKSWARRFKNYFPSINAYVYFDSPHWVCSVGDYRSRSEANEILMQIRSTSQFNSASVIRSKINNFTR